MDKFETLSTIDEMIAIVEGKVEGKMWVKGDDIRRVETPRGEQLVGMCLGGMMQHLMDGRNLPVVDVAVESFPPAKQLVPLHGLHIPLRVAIGKVILEQYPDRFAPAMTVDPASVVVPFNDDKRTTKEDVVRVLEKTRAALAEAV